jgi:cytochrome c-type biogenesis protein CcmH
MVVLTIGLLAVSPLVMTREASSQIEGDMEGSHPIGIENDTQRKVFFSLICMCGCPRETLGTCACNFAHARRNEIRAELAAGKTVEEIQAEYAKRYGLQALAVPPNSGANVLLWAVPLLAIGMGAIGVVFLVRKWRRGGSAAAVAAGGPVQPTDEYDAKLDRELQELDRE